MKATDLSKIIYECDIHALTDYYTFVEVKYDDADNKHRKYVFAPSLSHHCTVFSSWHIVPFSVRGISSFIPLISLLLSSFS